MPFSEIQIRLMKSCAELYYKKEYSYEGIAEELDITRYKVTSLLKDAESLGYVLKAPVQLRFPTEFTLEEELKSKFNLVEARVVKIGEKSLIKDGLGEILAKDVNSKLKDISVKKGSAKGVKLGLSGGTTLLAFAEHYCPKSSFEGLTIFPLGISIEPKDVRVHANTVVGLLSSKLEKATSYALQVPPIILNPNVDPIQEKKRLLAMAYIDEVYEEIKDTDIAVLGISDFKSGVAIQRICNYFLKEGILSEEDVRWLNENAKGEILYQPFLADGTFEDSPILSTFTERTISGLTLKDLRQMVKAKKQIILVATGSEKKAAIAGALEGGFANLLYTDEEIARALLTGEILETEETEDA